MFVSCEPTGHVTKFNGLIIEHNHVQYTVQKVVVDGGNSEEIYLVFPISDTVKVIPTVINARIPGDDDSPSRKMATVIFK